MRFLASEVAEATGGRIEGEDIEIDGAGFDSRSIAPGELFVAVRADRDGHEYIEAAIANGASAYLTDGKVVPDATAIVVPDVRQALYALARHARAKLTKPVVAVTGSNGKTSVKDLLRSIFGEAGKVNATEGSFNNELGLPLTLINAVHVDGYTVLEMGARGMHQIAELCAIASPDIGIVTNVGVAHIGEFGSQDAIAQTKGELIEALPATGTAILNNDDPRVRAMSKRTKASILTFGMEDADVSATKVELDELQRADFDLVAKAGRARVQMNLHGRHQVSNATAAAAAALAAGVEIEHVIAGLQRAEPSKWRMQVERSRAGVVVVNDAYNANPVSMQAALRSLAAMDVPGTKVAVLGEMAELGAISEDEHRKIAALAESLGLTVIAFGTDAYGIEPITEIGDVIHRLASAGDGDAVLVKGSRVAGLERVAEVLLDRPA